MRSIQDVQPLAEEDKEALRAELVPAMLSLSAPTDKAIRAQVAESVALIAELDFPAKWENLIDVRRVKTNPFRLLNLPCSATYRFFFCHRLQHQCRCSANCSFHLSAVASPRTVR